MLQLILQSKISERREYFFTSFKPYFLHFLTASISNYVQNVFTEVKELMKKKISSLVESLTL